MQGKILVGILHVQTELGQIRYHVPTLSHFGKGALCGRYLSLKIDKFFKTTILTLVMDTSTITMVKYESQMVF